jgi:hypothetical protein
LLTVVIPVNVHGMPINKLLKLEKGPLYRRPKNRLSLLCKIEVGRKPLAGHE